MFYLVLIGGLFLTVVRMVQRDTFHYEVWRLRDHKPFVDFDERLVNVPTPDVVVC